MTRILGCLGWGIMIIVVFGIGWGIWTIIGFGIEAWKRRRRRKRRKRMIHELITSVRPKEKGEEEGSDK